MIGIYADDESTAVEFRPVVPSKKLRWLRIKVPFSLPSKFWGEWGFAFGSDSIWIYKGNAIHFWQYPFVKQ